MTYKPVAIANSRVSSYEQLLSNSLNRQQMSVDRAAEKLGVEIVQYWSGSVSSKAGTNVKRKDLLAMVQYCKDHKNVKYAIFDEYDRYMRSVNEGPYFEVVFQQLGVKVWYASETDQFNGDDAMAKFQRAMSAYRAEGSNEERQKKSISGQTAALKLGKWPFAPKPGYKKGYRSGIPDIHEVRGPILKATLLNILSYKKTPTQALKDFNDSDFTKGHSPYKMDKFRKIVTDPFNAGVVEVDKQVQYRNENGLHEPLITLSQHYRLVEIMDMRKKTQSGPRANGNPKYPCNNIVTCDACNDKTNGRLVGFDHGNGKPNSTLLYEKYRCRACGRYWLREDIHSSITHLFANNPITPDGIKILMNALSIVWKQKEGDTLQEITRLEQKIKSLEFGVSTEVAAAIDPTNASIKDDILARIDSKKLEIRTLTTKAEQLSKEMGDDKERFVAFALAFVENMGAKFLTISEENRKRCKQVMFPGGFYVDADKKVYTQQVSPLITLMTNKKARTNDVQAHLVRVTGL